MIARFIGGPLHDQCKEVRPNPQLYIPAFIPLTNFHAREDTPILRITTTHVYVDLGPTERGGHLYMYIGVK